MRLATKLTILACLSELAYGSLYLFPASPAALYIKYIATAGLCFVLYAIALALVRRGGVEAGSNQILWVIFVAGAIFRLTLLWLPPFTSDDIYRYIWDGRVQAAGINPYRYAPAAIELAPLRDSRIYPYVNHSDLPTIYPPLAQVGFLLAYLIGGGSLLGFKLLAFTAEMASGLLLVRLLGRIDPAKRRAALLYFWCPLPILEFFIGGHVDVLGIPFLIIFLDYMLAERPRRAALALAGAVLVKVLPIIFLPLVARRLGWKRTIEFGAIFGLAVLVSYLPYVGVGLKVFGSLGTYLENWSFNSPLFPVIWSMAGSYQQARTVCYGAIAIWTVTITLGQRDFARGLFWALAGAYLFFPTVYPWYLIWIVPLLVLVPSRAFLILLMLSQLSYWVQIEYRQNGQWHDSPVIRAIEYLPFFVMLGYDLLRVPSRPYDK